MNIKKAPKKVWVLRAFTAIVTVTVVAVAVSAAFTGNAELKGAAMPAQVNITLPTATAAPAPDLTAHRKAAVDAYMAQQEFAPGSWAVGVDNLVLDSEALEGGTYNFGDVISSREEMAGVFTSTDPGTKASADRAVARLASVGISRAEASDANNWEVVQVHAAMKIEGLKGFSKNGNIVNLSARESDAGDAVWLFVDPDSDTVKSIPSDEGATVVMIRVGCTNPGENLHPKNPWIDPAQQGTAPDGGGSAATSGPGTYIPATGMDQPGDTSHVNPTAPTPTTTPAPVVTPAPGPHPTVVPSTQPPGNGELPTEGGPGCNSAFQNC